MHADWNWLQDLHRHGDEPDLAQAMPVFSGGAGPANAVPNDPGGPAPKE
jgi:hypothetical protein